MKIKIFLRYSILLSAIIASTFPAVFALWAIPKSVADSQPHGNRYAIIFFMALIGYSGWWRLLFFYDKKPIINIVLLSTGIVSFIWFYSIEGDLSQNISFPLNKKEILTWYIYIYPAFIALCFILHFGIAYLRKQLDSRPAHNKL